MDSKDWLTIMSCVETRLARFEDMQSAMEVDAEDSYLLHLRQLVGKIKNELDDQVKMERELSECSVCTEHSPCS